MITEAVVVAVIAIATGAAAVVIVAGLHAPWNQQAESTWTG